MNNKNKLYYKIISRNIYLILNYLCFTVLLLILLISKKNLLTLQKKSLPIANTKQTYTYTFVKTI